MRVVAPRAPRPHTGNYWWSNTSEPPHDAPIQNSPWNPRKRPCFPGFMVVNNSWRHVGSFCSFMEAS